MAWGLRITPPGVNALTNTDPKQWLFNSDYNTLKLYKWGTATFTTNGSGNATATIAHNLDYAPAFYVFRKDTANWPFMDASSYSNAYLPVGGPNYWSSDDLHHAIHAYADEDNLYIQANGGQASTLMEFRYCILVDLSQEFSSGAGASPRDFTFRVSQPTVNVLTAEEYQLQYSSDYKALEYHSVSPKSGSISLPAMFASHHDSFEEEGTYIDFEHGLGFAPFFFATFAGSSRSAMVPYAELNGIDNFNYMVSGFSDATRVRISFWRSTTFFAGSLLDDWPAETLTIRAFIFTENLAGAASP